LKPLALSPQSAARAAPPPIAATATIENNSAFKTLSRICPRSGNIIADLETAKRKTGLKIGGIGPFEVIGCASGRYPGFDDNTIRFWLWFGIFLQRWLRQILNRFAYCHAGCVTRV
jgi:hypothetical protein